MSPLAIFTWNIDPEIFSLGALHVRWYGLFFALAFVFGNYIMVWIFKRENLPEKYLDRMLIYMVIGTILGARLGHVLFYEAGYYLTHPLEILKIWKGGLASHGAGIGLLTASWLYSRKTPNQSLLWVIDRMVIVVALGGAMIRIGNFFNSEIIGKPTDANWGIIFQRIDSIPRHPAQLYESASYLLIFLMLFVIYVKTDLAEKRGFLGGFLFVTIFIARFVIEFFKENQSAFESGMLINMGQSLSIPMVLFGLALMTKSLLFPGTAKKQ